MRPLARILGLWFIIMSFVVPMSVSANNISVTLNGIPIWFDVEPQMMNDRTMVPLRAIFEALGATVEWEDETKTVFAMKDDVLVTATIGSTKMYINEEERTMDVAPMIVDERTFVPVRFVAEAFECDVDWDDNTQTVIITQEYNDVIYNNLGEQGED